MGLIRLQLMCIHLRFVIRLPIATEADTFDVETQALDLAVAYHCQLVMESVFTKKHNKQKHASGEHKLDTDIRAHQLSHMLVYLF